MGRKPTILLFFNVIMVYLVTLALAMGASYCGINFQRIATNPRMASLPIAMEALVCLVAALWFLADDKSACRRMLAWPARGGALLVLRWCGCAVLLALGISALRVILNIESETSVFMQLHDPIAQLIFLVTACVVVPAGYSLLFLGYFQDRMTALWGATCGILSTAIVVGLMHANLLTNLIWPLIFKYHFGSGYAALLGPDAWDVTCRMAGMTLLYGAMTLYMGCLFWRHQTLWPAFIVFAGYNLSVFLSVNFPTLETLLIRHAGMSSTAVFPYLVLGVCGLGLWKSVRKVS